MKKLLLVAMFFGFANFSAELELSENKESVSFEQCCKKCKANFDSKSMCAKKLSGVFAVSAAGTALSSYYYPGSFTHVGMIFCAYLSGLCAESAAMSKSKYRKHNITDYASEEEFLKYHQNCMNDLSAQQLEK